MQLSRFLRGIIKTVSIEHALAICAALDGAVSVENFAAPMKKASESVRVTPQS